tara:strand:+ start:272 stop:496 length:225 start_codon:yes stop_codon:yes gene_type:complete
MSQLKDLEDCMFEIAKDESISASDAEEYFANICHCLDLDNSAIDQHADSLFDRVICWQEWCNSDTLSPSNYIQQ